MKGCLEDLGKAWVSGHEGYQDMEKADELAREGLDRAMTGPFCGVTIVEGIHQPMDVKKSQEWWNNKPKSLLRTSAKFTKNLLDKKR